MNQILAVTSQILRGRGFPALALAACLALLLSASAAKAGCAVPYKPGAGPTMPFVSPPADDEWNEHSTIVGLWHVLYTGTFDDNFPPGGPFPPANTPFPFLESLKTWHADGTEFENAFLPPTGGNICFGVWKDLGFGRVKLHHIGLMFAQAGTPPEYVGTPPQFLTNIFTVDETDAVAPNGKTYSGSFDFRLYVPSACENKAGGYVCTGTPMSEVKGTTFGTRITAD
jgi:hypothetical protein